MILGLALRICFITCLGMVLVSPITQCVAEEISESESKAIIDSVNQMGEGYQSEIATAKIDYQHAYLGFKDLQLTPEETHQRLKTLDFSDLKSLMPKAMKAFEEKMHTQNLHVRERWTDKQLIVRGKDFVSKGVFHDQLLEGDLHLVFDLGNNQVSGYNPGQSRLMTEELDSFRLIPDPRMFEDATLYKSSDYETSHLIDFHFNGTPENPGTVGTFNPENGLLQHMVVARGPGDPFKELIYEQFTTFPGGILLPMLKVEIDYREKILKTIQFTIIKNAELNGDIADSEFVRTMPKGAGWFDYRTGEKTGGMFKQEVSDVCEFYRSRKAQRTISPVNAPATGSNLTTWIFLVNGLVLIVIGVILWRRTP